MKYGDITLDEPPDEDDSDRDTVVAVVVLAAAAVVVVLEEETAASFTSTPAVQDLGTKNMVAVLCFPDSTPLSFSLSGRLVRISVLSWVFSRRCCCYRFD